MMKKNTLKLVLLSGVALFLFLLLKPFNKTKGNESDS